MELISANKLIEMRSINKRKFEGLFPELVERLLIASNSSAVDHRFPSRDDIWAPGYDGLAEFENSSDYVTKGKSVWEFGTNDDLISKINSDYEKRTRNSMGIDKKDTGFYLVISKIWKYKTPLTKWISEHDDWAYTKVYDAVVLCKWLNSEPTVCLWLLEEVYGDTQLDFATPYMGWNRFSRMTNPKFVKDMFLLEREEQIEMFNGKLMKESGNIRVKAETRIDSVGFALSVILQEKSYSDCCIVINNFETYKRISSISKGKILLLTYPHNGELFNDDNRIIFCYNKESTSITDAIELPSLCKSSYQKALKKMGFSDGDITDLFAFTHGNLHALIRRKPGNYEEPKPGWAEMGSIDNLTPLVLLQSIDKDKDRKIVERLAGCDFELIEKQYYSLAQLEDAPLKIVRDHYVIINYEEAWNTLSLSPSENHFRLFATLLKDMLSSLSKTGQYDGRYVIEYREVLKRLIKNFVYYSRDGEDEKLDATILDILKYSYEPRVSESVIKNMKFLAVARHGLVASYLLVVVLSVIYVLPQCIVAGYEKGAPLYAIIVMIPVMLLGGGLEEAGWRLYSSAGV